MENTELISIWKAQNARIEQSLEINKLLLKELINSKARHSLNALARLKTGGIIAFTGYILLLAYVLVFAISHYTSALNYFIVSVGAILLINLKGLADYIKHLVWVNRINYDGSVMEIQGQLCRLQLSIIRHARGMCLQFPFYTTWYLSGRWFPGEAGPLYTCLQILVTGALCWLSWWLYKQHKPENLDKKWFRNLIAGSGLKPVQQAMEFYKDMEAFKKES